MTYEGFYRYIYKQGKEYWIVKDNEKYFSCKTLAEALYERDRLVGVNWDWDLFLELPKTMNGYIHIDLPPFTHKATYIAHINEYWTVLSKGRNPKYYGNYHSEKEADRVRRIYDGRIVHRREKWRVQRRFNGKNVHFGTFDNRDDAEERVKELEEKGWIKND